MATKKSTKARSPRATPKQSVRSTAGKAAKRIRAERRLDLILHFEAIFDRVLKDYSHCSRAEVVEKLTQETVSWIEGFDDMLSTAG